VLPHVTRAIELKDRLALGAGVSTSLMAIADSLPIGVLLVDGQSRILQASQIAVTPEAPARYLELSRTLESRDHTEFASGVF
jgi:hypothetical protein